jgi:redox-sensing transcriptional repressor
MRNAGMRNAGMRKLGTMPDRTGNPRISQPAVRRYSHYYRTLLEARGRGDVSVSSRELAERTGVTSVQVRKDLSMIGTFGKRGLGYPVDGLLYELAQVLGLDSRWPMVLAGVGHLGTALLNSARFRRKGFPIVAAFDVDEERIGTMVGGLHVQHIDLLPHVIRQLDARIGIIACSPHAAQEVCDQMVKAGLRALLTFMPVNLEVPAGVRVRHHDILVELEALSFGLRQEEELSEDVDNPGA